MCIILISLSVFYVFRERNCRQSHRRGAIAIDVHWCNCGAHWFAFVSSSCTPATNTRETSWIDLLNYNELNDGYHQLARMQFDECAKDQTTTWSLVTIILLLLLCQEETSGHGGVVLVLHETHFILSFAASQTILCVPLSLSHLSLITSSIPLRMDCNPVLELSC